MTSFPDQLRTLLSDARIAVSAAQDADALRNVDVTFLGRKGRFATLARSVAGAPAADRPAMGRALNEVKRELSTLLDDARTRLDGGAVAPAIDPTVPGVRPRRGSLHPVTQMLERVWDVFSGMGYELVDGPDVELDQYNFQALNMPPTHPARDMQDTFYLDPRQELLLRTQTTAVTLGRELGKRPPPFQILSTGACYRRDEDLTHTPMFHQFDGAVVGAGVTFANLKGTLQTAMRRILETDVAVRFRISYFPFVEPGAEFDLALPVQPGQRQRWLEMGGCGMIHPSVLRRAGLDPEQVSGFAFGFGVERPFMIKHGVPDLRLFFENDLRFLNQF